MTDLADLGLGRVPAPDPGDDAYPMASVLPAEADDRTIRYWWTDGAWLNQGRTSTCVGHGWAHWLADGPVTQVRSLIDPIGLYRRLILVDEWTQNDHEADAPIDQLRFGSSVRAGARVLQSDGLIDSYWWAPDVETSNRAVLTTGPVVYGTIWPRAMFSPDAEGIIRSLDGPIDGGHCYVKTGVNLDRGMSRFKNSWGRSWGKRGAFWLPMELEERLIAADGEVCLALERKGTATV